MLRTRDSSLAKQLFGYAILGFALTEAIALFAPMMAFPPTPRTLSGPRALLAIFLLAELPFLSLISMERTNF